MDVWTFELKEHIEDERKGRRDDRGKLDMDTARTEKVHMTYNEFIMLDGVMSIIFEEALRIMYASMMELVALTVNNTIIGEFQRATATPSKAWKPIYSMLSKKYFYVLSLGPEGKHFWCDQRCIEDKCAIEICGLIRAH